MNPGEDRGRRRLEPDRVLRGRQVFGVWCVLFLKLALCKHFCDKLGDKRSQRIEKDLGARSLQSAGTPRASMRHAPTTDHPFLARLMTHMRLPIIVAYELL
jgi:hypothetical protein